MVSESACQPTMGSRSTRAPPSGRRLALALGTVVLAVILAVATAVPIFGTFGGASGSRAPRTPLSLPRPPLISSPP